MIRHAKIIATLGPSSQDEAVITRMIEAGMDVARLNFSHGTHADHAARIASLRKLSKEMGKPITILQDLQGPKIRVGTLAQPVDLVAGQKVVLQTVEDGKPLREIASDDAVQIPVEIPDLPRIVTPGSRILLNDGQLEFLVTSTEPDRVEAKVLLGGVLSSHKGVNLPGTKLPFPGFTEKDREDLAFGLSQGVDAVAISFVRSPDDIELVRNAILEISPKQGDLPIIAKLERPEALDNLEEIIKRSDGVMVARGDLGVELSPAVVPIAQKQIIEVANRNARLVITATQMLESMITNPRPTRAEASDVANAIFDGTDAVMLSGESAAGKFPVESIAMMSAIVIQAEENFHEWGHCDETPVDRMAQDDAVSLTRAATELAYDRNVAAIAVFSQTGRTAMLMSKARPRVPIFAFTPITRTYQRMGMYWGVVPFLIPYASTTEAMLSYVEEALISSASIQAGQQVVLLSGFPVGAMRPPNFALLHTIGSHPLKILR